MDKSYVNGGTAGLRGCRTGLCAASCISTDYSWIKWLQPPEQVVISGRWAQAYHSAADSAFGTHDNLISHNNLSRGSRGVDYLTGWKSINPVLTERMLEMTHLSLSASPLHQLVSAGRQRGQRSLLLKL